MLNTAYLALYRTGALKKDPAYTYHYFARNLVSPGDNVLDLGANLGYYSNLFAQWVGPNGSLYSVEPVSVFQRILHWKLDKFKHVTILPFALGTEEKDIRLVIPAGQKYFKTGLPHVYEGEKDGSLDEYGYVFEARMKKAASLFDKLERIDFIKCDIEGYEEFVLPDMKEILERHKPIVQVETWGEHKPVIDKLFHDLGYSSYQVVKGKLAAVKNGVSILGDDYIFVHPQNAGAMKKIAPFT